MRLIAGRSRLSLAFVMVALAAICLGALSASAQAEKPIEKQPGAQPVPAQPQQTTASFGDWVARCQKVGEPEKNVCDAAQSLVVKGQSSPIAQIALSQAEKPGTITVLLPTNIAFDKPPQIGEDETHMLTLTFRRCVPGGCLADAKLDASALALLRNASKPGRLVFTDAGDHTLTLPFSFRGLAQALDYLTKVVSAR